MNNIKTTQNRLAIIGCGFIGMKYIQYLSNCSIVQIQIVCDNNINSLKELLSKYKITRYETDWHYVVRANDIDTVCIFVPNDMHFAIAKEALKNKKNVICEKPLGQNAKQSISLTKLAKLNNLRTHCCYNLIHIPAIQYAKRLIESGVLGELVSFRGSYNNGRLSDPMAPFEWRMMKSYTEGGALNDLAVNVIAISQFLLGDIESVCGITKIVHHNRYDNNGIARNVENDDVAQFMFIFYNNALGFISANRVSPGSKQNMQFEIQFTKGVIKYSLERMNEILIYKDNNEGFLSVISDNNNWFDIGYDELKRIDIECFFANNTFSTQNETDFLFAAKVDCVISAVIESSRTKKWVNTKKV